MSFFIRKEQKFGIVTVKDKNKVTVAFTNECSPSKICHAGCGACGGISNKQKNITITDSTDDYSIGQKVSIKCVILNESIAAFVVFGIPILFSLICIVGWSFSSPETVDSPLAILMTAVSFMLGFPAVWFIDRIFHKKYPAEITGTINHFSENLAR